MENIVDHKYWMAKALVQAEIGLSLAEVPVGAVAIYQGEIIGAGYNRKESDQDPTRHAEIIAMQEAARVLGNWRLIDVTLYCTLEPCPMCAGAMIQARLPHLVYGAKDIRFGADGSLLELFAIEDFNHRVSVTEGVMADEAAALLQSFFRQLRDSKLK